MAWQRMSFSIDRFSARWPAPQRLEQGTHNLAFAPRDIRSPRTVANMSDSERTRTTVVRSTWRQRPQISLVTRERTRSDSAHETPLGCRSWIASVRLRGRARAFSHRWRTHGNAADGIGGRYRSACFALEESAQLVGPRATFNSGLPYTSRSGCPD
jgi:hypothetical protein